MLPDENYCLLQKTFRSFFEVVKLYKQMKLQNMPENTILHLADIVQEKSNSRTKMKIKIFFERKKFVRKSVAPKKGSPNL